MIEGRKVSEQEERQKCLGVLGLEVAIHSWKTLVMGYISYSLLIYLIWQGDPRTDAFNAAICGVFFTFFMSFDTNFKTKMGVLASKLQNFITRHEPCHGRDRTSLVQEPITEMILLIPFVQVTSSMEEMHRFYVETDIKCSKRTLFV